MRMLNFTNLGSFARVAQVCWAVFMALTLGNLKSAENFIYQATFDSGDRAPVGWAGENGVVWDNFGHNGRSLRISTWEKDGTKGKWSSDLMEIKPGIMNMGVWTAQNLVWTQDPGYCGIVATVFYNADKKEISKNKLIDITKPDPRGNGQGVTIVPEGLNWDYKEAEFTVPANAKYLQLIFTWSEFLEAWRSASLINGEAWIGGLSLFEGPLAKGKFVQKESLPYKISLKTPLEISLFIPDDPLQFDVLIYNDSNELIALDKDLELQYEITDYRRLVVYRGTVPFSNPAKYDWKEGDKPHSGYMKTIKLDEKIKEAEGKWLALEVKLTRKKQMLGKGDISFAVLNPDLDKNDNCLEHHFIRGTVNGRYREYNCGLYSGWQKADPPKPWNKYHPTWGEILGEKGIGWLGWETSWQARQPSKDFPVDFSKDPTEPAVNSVAVRDEIPFEKRIPSYAYMPYNVVKCAPKWAEKTGTDGRYDIDAEAYGKYAEELAKHLAVTHIFVTCPEGQYAQDCPDLVVAAAKAMKKFDPRIKVGVCANIVGGKTAVSAMSKDVLELVDFFDNDMYNSRADVSGFRQELDRLGYKNKEIWLQEYCDMSPKDQVGKSRSLLRFLSYTIANGVDKLFWWSRPGQVYAMNNERTYSFGPDIRGSYILKTDLQFSAGWRTEGGGVWGKQIWYPFLDIITEHHMLNHLGFAKNGKTVDFGPNSEAYMFTNDRFPGKKGKNISVLVAFKTPGSRYEHLMLNSRMPYEMVDIYGGRRKVDPIDNISFLTIGEDPIMINFEGLVDDVAVKPAPIKVCMNNTMPPGSIGEVTIELANPFSKSYGGTISVEIGSDWGLEPKEINVKLAGGANGKYKFKLKVPDNSVPGEYPLFITLSDKTGGKYAQIEERFKIGEVLDFKAETRPAMPLDKSEIRVNVVNNSGKDSKGKMSFVNPVTRKMRPGKLIQDYTVPANGETTVTFKIDGKPELTRSYEAEFTLEDTEGKVVKKMQELSFVGVPKVKKAIIIDGDISDWDTANMVPMEFFCDRGEKGRDYNINNPTNLWTGKNDASVKLYMAWDDKKIYWIADITDDVQFNDGEYSGIWPYDCLHFCIYPWEFKKGDGAKGVSYKDHCGIDKNGKSTIDRVQSPVDSHPSTPGWWPKGTEFVAKKTDKGYIYECAYSRDSLAPLEFKVGSKFRMAATYLDNDGKKSKKSSGLGGVSWYFGTGNVDGNISAFCELTLIE